MSNFLTLAANPTEELSGGLIGVLFGLAIIALAICWLLFPFLVWSKLNDVLKCQREANRHLAAIRAVSDEQNDRAKQAAALHDERPSQPLT
jgi:hypothetical protein